MLAGKFRVVRLLGEGGMGAVLEAENQLTGKRVAIKWMHPTLGNQADSVPRVLQEARAASRVVHPNVIDVYDVVADGGDILLVMELLKGEPLSAVLERGGMPLHQLISLSISAMRGVAEAHRLGVIHRDIKPDNIFLARLPDRELPEVKVLDFGISKLLLQDGNGLTRTGAVLGTPLYMSPEQLRDPREIDARTDVYAFGAILYQAVTGRLPVEAHSLPQLIYLLNSNELVPAKHFCAALPTALDRVISWALARERNARIASLTALISELEPFASEHALRGQMTHDDAESLRVAPSRRATEGPTRGTADDSPGHQPTSPARTAGSTRVERRRLYLGLGGAAIVLLASGAWLIGGAPLRSPEHGGEAMRPRRPPASARESLASDAGPPEMRAAALPPEQAAPVSVAPDAAAASEDGARATGPRARTDTPDAGWPFRPRPSEPARAGRPSCNSRPQPRHGRLPPPPRSHRNGRPRGPRSGSAPASPGARTSDRGRTRGGLRAGARAGPR